MNLTLIVEFADGKYVGQLNVLLDGDHGTQVIRLEGWREAAFDERAEHGGRETG
jgi:hypothetical protein